MAFEYTIEQQNKDYSFLSIMGEININTAEHFKAALEFIVKNGRSDINIECGKLEYMDSSGLQALLSAKEMLAGSGREIRFLDMKSYIRKLFSITNTETFFIFDRSKGAVA